MFTYYQASEQSFHKLGHSPILLYLIGLSRKQLRYNDANNILRSYLSLCFTYCTSLAWLYLRIYVYKLGHIWYIAYTLCRPITVRM